MGHDTQCGNVTTDSILYHERTLFQSQADAKLIHPLNCKRSQQLRITGSLRVRKPLEHGSPASPKRVSTVLAGVHAALPLPWRSSGQPGSYFLKKT